MRIRIPVLILFVLMLCGKSRACTCDHPTDIIQSLERLFPWILNGTVGTDKYALVKVVLAGPTPDGRGVYMHRLDTWFGRASRDTITCWSGTESECLMDFQSFLSIPKPIDTFVFFLHRAPSSAPAGAEEFTGSICHDWFYVKNDSAYSNFFKNAFTYRGFPLSRLEDSVRAIVRTLGVTPPATPFVATLWPNPLPQGSPLKIQGAGAGPAAVSIRDMQGRLCASVALQAEPGQVLTCSLPALCPGTYTVTLRQAGRTQRQLLTVAAR